ncbi:MAG: GntR family transcriptional regulator [Gemmatimonadetes bacterium]|nr:GntR family transcriptional regulator [Gemmatimonadota bacterium]
MTKRDRPAGRRPARSPSTDGKNRRGDRVTETYRQLRELIVWGRLAPGSRIIETDIATKIGVSRTPVRSALQRLQQEGYIVVSGSGQQSRLSVAPLTQNDARELFAIVSELEALAARWAAERDARARSRVAEELRRLNSDLSRSAHEAPPDPHEIFDLDQAFHLCFTEAGAGPRLLVMHRAVKPQSERYVRLYISALVDELDRSVHDHDDIADAIEAGDPEAAKSAVLRNWQSAGERLEQVIERLGERGHW